MSIFVLPPIYYAVFSWTREFGLSHEKKASVLKTSLISYGAITTVFTSSFHGANMLDILPETWGNERLAAFLIGQFIFGLLLFAPLVVVPTAAVKEEHIKKA